MLEPGTPPRGVEEEAAKLREGGLMGGQEAMLS